MKDQPNPVSPRRPHIEMQGCTFNECGTGVEADGWDITANDTKIVKTDIGFLLKDSSAIPGAVVHKSDTGSSHNGSNDHWYKKPVGIIAIGITTGTTVLILRAAAMAFFPQWFR